MSDREASRRHPPEWNADVSDLLKNIYRCADKSSWYDAVAAAYDRTRPRYPAQILAWMQDRAKLQAGKSVLEIGAGPGIATLELAQSGAKIVCLEPSKSACAIARDKCTAYPNVEVINTTFEEWELRQKFDVVVATTSFHWVTPEVRYVKSARALKERGLLILLWNTPPQPSYEVHQSLQDVYQIYAPELRKYETHQNHQQNIDKIAQSALDSGYFRDLTTHQAIIQVSYTIDDYLTLLSTLSPYIRLLPEQRQTLFTALKRSLNQYDQLDLAYLSLVQILYKS